MLSRKLPIFGVGSKEIFKKLRPSTQVFSVSPFAQKIRPNSTIFKSQVSSFKSPFGISSVPFKMSRSAYSSFSVGHPPITIGGMDNINLLKHSIKFWANLTLRASLQRECGMSLIATEVLKEISNCKTHDDVFHLLSKSSEVPGYAHFCLSDVIKWHDDNNEVQKILSKENVLSPNHILDFVHLTKVSLTNSSYSKKM